MNVEDHFSHPQKTCRWAEKEVAKFERIERLFFEENPPEEWTYFEVISGQQVHGVEFKSRPPESLEQAAYRVVGDLRNALDQAVYAGARALGVEKPKWTNFPIAETEMEFGRRLTAPKGQYRDIPAQLHDKLISFEPFWPDSEQGKGNRLLRALAEMSNPNKHHLPLGIECQTGMRFYGGRGLLAFGTKWDWKGRTELYRTNPRIPHEINMQLEPRIAFGEIAGMAGKPVTRTFREMLPMVQTIIVELEAETRNLIG